MKKLAYTSIVVVILVAAAAAQAPVVARTTIPFSFNAHEQTFNHGEYELRRIGAQTLRLQETNGQGVTLLSAQNVAGLDDVKLIFRVYTGNHQFLASVVAATFHIAVPKSKEETEIMASGQKPRTVQVAAGR